MILGKFSDLLLNETQWLEKAKICPHVRKQSSFISIVLLLLEICSSPKCRNIMGCNEMKNITTSIRNNVRALFNFSWKIGGNSAYRVFEGALT